MKNHTVHVLQEDIDKSNEVNDGKIGDGDSCPVYFAILREDIFDSSYLHVARSWVDSRDRMVAKLPDIAILRIVEYDKTGKMSPFEFELMVWE